MSTHDMSFLVYLSIFFLGWLIDTLAGWLTGDDVKYWSWIIVHAYPSYKSTAGHKEHGYMTA